MIRHLKAYKFTWMDIMVHIYLAALCLTSYAYVAHGSPYKDVLISTAQIAKALCNQGACVSENEIVMAASVVSSKNDPRLEILKTDEVTSSDIEGGEDPKRLWVMLGCRGEITCNPFYIQVTNPPKSLTEFKAPQNPVAVLNPRTNKGKIIIGSNSLAMLEIVRNRSKIQLQVMTIDAGRLGDEIRVRSIGGKHLYKVKVLSSTLLEEVSK